MIKRILLALWIPILLASSGRAQSPAPALFFSDLISGPNSGGANGGGVYVTLYGNNLTRASVTLNGASCLTVVIPATSWMWYQKIVVQLTPTCTSGNFVVGSSNPIPFTVRSGPIYFVSMTGNDSNPGTFASPWQTIPHAVQTAGAVVGSTIYAMNGVSATVDDGQSWDTTLLLRTAWCQGTAAAPNALIAYPGAAVTIGNSGTSPTYGLRVTNFSATGGACPGHWVLGGIKFTGVIAIETDGPSTDWRIVGNEVTNPQSAGIGGGSASLVTSSSTFVEILGNNGHDLNLASKDRLTQGFYLSTDSNNSEMAWNTLNNAKGRSCIQTHSSPVGSGTGFAMFAISIHDNLVHDCNEEGIIIDTVDPSKGAVTVYNNVVYNVGKDGHSNGAIYIARDGDFDTSHGTGTGTVQIYNNTIFDYLAGPAFGFTFAIHDGLQFFSSIVNNLILSRSAGIYIQTQSNSPSDYRSCDSTDTPTTCPSFSGSNTILYGAGAGAGLFGNFLTGTITLNPMLVNPAGGDAHLQAGSPAICAGVDPGITLDLDGNAPNRAACSPSTPLSLGAFQGKSSQTRPIAPQGLRVTKII